MGPRFRDGRDVQPTMRFDHKNKITLSITAAIIMIVATGVFVSLKLIPLNGGPRVAEAQSCTPGVYPGSCFFGYCQNTNSRADSDCGNGCDAYDNTSAPYQTLLWNAYEVDILVVEFNTDYYFTITSQVCSDGDHYYADYPSDPDYPPNGKTYANNSSELIAGKCDCTLGGAYAICCNGSTPVPATPIIWPAPYSDPYQPPTAECDGPGVVKIPNSLSCPSSAPTCTPPASPSVGTAVQ